MLNCYLDNDSQMGLKMIIHVLDISFCNNDNSRNGLLN